MTNNVLLETNVAVLAMRARLTEELPEADRFGLKRVVLRLLMFAGDHTPLPPESAPVSSSELESLIDSHRNALKIWNELREQGVLAQKPHFPEKLGELFLRLARKVGANKRWAGQEWVEDAIGDGLLRCLHSWDKFDKARGSAYSFYYRVIQNRFLSLVEREQRQTRVKSALAEREFIEASRYGRRHGGASGYDQHADAA